MDIFNILQSMLYTVGFFIILVLAFFIPGNVLIARFVQDKFTNLILSVSLGIVLWAWQAWVFGLLEIRWVTYLYIAIFLILWIKSKQWKSLKFSKITLDKISLLIIVIGVILQLPNAIFNGIIVDGYLLFFSAHTPDQLWHAALAHQSVEHIIPFQPVLSDTLVSNYHIWADMTAGELVRIFKLPLFDVVFRYMAITISVLLGMNAIAFSKITKQTVIVQRMILFFLYFGGDILPFVGALLGNGFHFRMGSLENSALLLMNLPRAYAIVFFITGISMLSLWLKNRSYKTGILTVLIFSSLLGFKANVGIAAALGLGVLGLYYFLKKDRRMIVPLIIFVLLSLLVYLPINSNSGGLIYSGFWRVRDFIVHPELGLSRFELARVIFANDEKWFKVLFYDLSFLALYIVSTFGTGLIGLFQTPTSLRKFPVEVHIVLLSTIVSSLLLGLFFIQESGGANSFNFLATVFWVIAFYSGLTIGTIYLKIPKNIGIVIIIVIIIITIPRVLHESYFRYEGALSVLKNKKAFVVSSNDRNFFKFIKEHTPEKSLFLSGSYELSMLGNRQIFVGEGIGYSILGEHHIDASDRKAIRDTIYQTTEATIAAQLLYENKIDYIIGTLASDKSEMFLDTVSNRYSNTLYQVNKDKLGNFLK